MSKQAVTEAVVMVPETCPNATKPYTKSVVAAYAVVTVILLICIVYPILKTRRVKSALKKDIRRETLEAAN